MARMRRRWSRFVTLCPVFEDGLELRYGLDPSGEAQVLRSRAKNLADGRLHSVSVRRLSASVVLQVRGDSRTFQPLNPKLDVSNHHTLNYVHEMRLL